MVSLAYVGLHKLSSFIRDQKDKLHFLLYSNVVYKIKCFVTLHT